MEPWAGGRREAPIEGWVPRGKMVVQCRRSGCISDAAGSIAIGLVRGNTPGNLLAKEMLMVSPRSTMPKPTFPA